MYAEKENNSLASKSANAENIATTNVQTSVELAQCSAMEDQSSSDESDSELDRLRIFQFRQFRGFH